MDKYIGAEGLLRLMEGKKDRYWEIFNIVCYKDEKVQKIFIGVHKGKISKKLNHKKSGLIRDFDRVLIPDGYNKTFAEFTEEEVKEFNNKIWKQGMFKEFIKWYKK
jgi:XTP/dITP diphosphohydrolase